MSEENHTFWCHFYLHQKMADGEKLVWYRSSELSFAPTKEISFEFVTNSDSERGNKLDLDFKPHHIIFNVVDDCFELHASYNYDEGDEIVADEEHIKMVELAGWELCSRDKDDE